ncbi:hypothetical protein GGI04_002441 [Coemansia thaxteri]|nr:hypothetical protein GGI04_002441 [Coemansia thaxteri]KAJ2470968.1 hypothetical protein GGI02_002583 [Coemansia sp. RSA 2322]KAJ2484600.1 hypothetical protein EV174_002308 [Coemansia sp. RSA 2320]
MAFRASIFLRQELKVRPAFELALRSSCLQLVLSRWGLETAALMGLRGEQSASNDDRKERAVEAITKAMYESGLDEHATDLEREMLEKPYRSWEYKDYVYGDHWESFGVLQWILGRQHTIPAYYSSFDRARLFQSTGIMPADPTTVEKFVDPFMSSHMRQTVDASQLQHEVDIAEAWVWRARAQVLLTLREELAKETEADSSSKVSDTPVQAALRSKHIPHSLRRMAADLPKTIPLAAKRAHAKGLVKAVEDDDFAITVELKDTAGQHKSALVPYSSLDQDHLDSIRKIAESRFLAFAWSLGKADSWDVEKVGEIVSINPLSSMWTPNQS